MKEEDIIKFIKENIIPLDDNTYGPGYRASVYLTDGTYLPCVLFRNSAKTTDLAIRRFNDEKSGKGIFSRGPFNDAYREVVKTFVTKGNSLNSYDIAKVEASKYAMPIEILRQIRGETTMGWTGFAAKMKDGKYVGFGTTFDFNFFQLPDNYSMDDIIEIVNHSYVLNTGELKSHRPAFHQPTDDYQLAIVNRERPFFECFLESL